MQIILLANGFQPEYEAGFANGLARLGVESVLLSSDNTLVDRLDPGVKHLNLRGSQDPSRSRVEKVINILRYLWRYLRLIKQSESGVAHVIGLFSLRSPFSNLVEAVLLRLVARRFVLTVHNLLPHDRHSWGVFVIFWLLYRLPDSLIVHTQRAADELARRFGVPSNRITVIEHGVDRLLAPPPNRSAWLRRELGVDASVPLVLFFGSVSAYKGLDLLIDAFGSILGETSAVLVIAGRCRDVPVRQEIEKRLEPLQAIHRARWFDGFVPDNDVPRFFHGADVLVMPYRHIDQSGVLFMALSTGLPVVATDVGSLRDYVPMTGGIVVPPGDVGELARAILRGLDQSAKVNRTEVVATSERFLWRDTLRPLLDVYAKVSR